MDVYSAFLFVAILTVGLDVWITHRRDVVRQRLESLK